MMKLIIHWIYVLLFPVALFSQTFEWAKSAGGDQLDYPSSVITDANGNIFVTGYFASSNLTFGSTALINNGSNDVFITKYDANGNVLWAKSAGGNRNDNSYSAITDATGNVYITGHFASPTITFGSYTLSNVGETDIFLTKYDANGNVLWAKSAGGSGADYSRSVTIDSSGNIFVSGQFGSTITFGSTILTGIGDIFLTKYDANGNVLWAKSAGGNGADFAYSSITDANGDIFITGHFASPTIMFGSTTLVNLGNTDIFLTKYDANGNVLWARSAGGTNFDVSYSILTDAIGNIFVSGYFVSPTITFGSITLINNGDNDIFITKYDTNGNVLWANSAKGNGLDNSYSAITDVNGNVYITGSFASPTITFGSTTLTNNGDNDIFITKYDINGNVLWAKRVGGSKSDFARSIAIDTNENVYVVGSFSSPTLTFGSTTLNSNSNSTNDYDIFIARVKEFKNAFVYPINLSVGNKVPLTFKWKKDDSALTYNLKVSTNDLMTSPLINSTIVHPDTTYFASNLSRGSQYFWQVTSENLSKSEIWFFGTFTSQIDSPQLYSPSENEIQVSLKPTFSWTNVFESAYYVFQISTTSDFASIYQSSETFLTHIQSDSLLYETTYYWRVRAYIQGDTSNWSHVKSFTTIPQLPKTPTLLHPDDAAINVPVNSILYWSEIHNASTYDLQISNSPAFSTLVKDTIITDTLYRTKEFYNPSTTYFWRIKSINNGGSSNFSNTFRFTTGVDTNKPKISFQNINLGMVQSGSTIDTAIVITNSGNDDLIISAFTKPSWSTFNLSSLTISSNTSTTAEIRLISIPAGEINGNIILISNTPSSPDTINITGFGATYGLSLSSNSVSFGNVTVGQLKDTVIIFTNTGNVNLNISHITSDNLLFSASPSALIIEAGSWAKDTIRFSSTTTGVAAGKIIINSNAPSSPDTITVSANGILTSIHTDFGLPTEYSLSQNYPNPFNPSTILRYGIPQQSNVRISIFNTLGQLVSTEDLGKQDSGYYENIFNATELPSGFYFYRIEAISQQNPDKTFVSTRKMLLLK